MAPVLMAPVLMALVMLVSACSSRPGAEIRDGDYRATITRTSFGIPHIVAADLASLGFGEGYAQAEDHLCSIADQVIKARGERSRYFGDGARGEHLTNDLVMRALGIHGQSPAELAAETAEIQGWYRGFAAGYNRYLEETGRDGVGGWCRGADWVVPIDAQDLLAYARQVTLVLPRFADAIAAAQPPAAEQAKPAQPARAADANLRTDLAMPRLATQQGASNGWAIGSERSASGGGMLVANPHYPWVGSNRFWEKHLHVPGDLDVYGVGLIGIPGVAIGFNRSVAWTHTVSAGSRLTLMRLDLVPGDPTRYRYGDDVRALEARTVEIEVRGQDGSIETEQRTVWFSHHGPIVALPGLGWTAEHAYAVRDANQDNDEARSHWLAMNRADGLDALQAAHATYQGMPWVNTIATSADGRAWYADTASTPKLSDEAIDAWVARRESDPATRALWQRSGLVLLDGSDPRFDWQADPEARDPGIVPYRDTPQLERRDYVWNANDSFWLANAQAPIEGDFSPLHGAQRTVRSLRSRNNEIALRSSTPDGAAGDDGRFDLDELTNALLANNGLAARLLRTELVSRCRSRPELTRACDVLDGWDGRHDAESRGAVLFREWITRYSPADLRGSDDGRLWATGFDPDDPIGTPRGLARATGAGDIALERLAAAVELLNAQGIGLDTPLGDLQFHDKAGRRVAVHGGDGGYEGLLNMQRNGRNRTTLEPMSRPAAVDGSRFLTEAGYPVLHGSSFILVLAYETSGPRGQAILTYSQSGDPASPHFADQTDRFARKQLRPVLFDETDIAADAQRVYEVSGTRQP